MPASCEITVFCRMRCPKGHEWLQSTIISLIWRGDPGAPESYILHCPTCGARANKVAVKCKGDRDWCERLFTNQEGRS